MTKDRDPEEEENNENDINEGGQAESPSEPNLALSSSGVVKERGRKWGWLLSGIIFLNILILGCALVSGTAYSSVNVSGADMQIYLIILMILTIIWMLYYTFYTSQRSHAILYKDGHAGPVWLRAGLVLFGVLGLLMDIFKIANYVGYLHCDSAVKVAFPVVQVVFILVQTYFLWIHAKDCVQLQWNLTRCGLMLMLGTNLVLWMTAVTEESVHQTDFPDDYANTSKLSPRSNYINRAGYGDDKCKCSYSACKIFKKAYYYLYPFNIEYCLFASCMAYVMWKNVGRLTEEHSLHHAKFRVKDTFVGPVAGILMLIAGLATFVVYEVEVEQDDPSRRDNALTMHFVYNIVIMIMMSVSMVVGCAVHRLDHRDHTHSEKNPTRSLDVSLLVGCSLGQFIICYFTIVAVVGTGAKGYLNGLNLAWAILTVIELGLQNFFLVEGLHREPYHEPQPVTVFSNPYVLQGISELSNIEGSDMDTKTMPCQSVHTVHNHNHTHNHNHNHSHNHSHGHSHGPHGHSHTAHAPEHKHKLTWKRRVQKEVCAFLLLCNIILWIMPAFGARPQFDHDVETNFYKFTLWSAVVNIGLPFGIFYRMHSVASLFEVYVIS